MADVSEARVQYEVLAHYGAHERVRLWRNNSGLYFTRTGQRVRASVVGAPDLLGLIAPSGRLLAIECKSASGRLRPEQESFGRMVLTLGGVYIVARSLADVARIVEPILAETAA